VAYGGIAFEQLDGDQDGLVSRQDLHLAARRLGWHWREAPLYAVLDLLSLDRPLSPRRFAKVFAEMAEDPLGPYGKVLHRARPLYDLKAPVGRGVAHPMKIRARGKEGPEPVSDRMRVRERILPRDRPEATGEGGPRQHFERGEPLVLPVQSAALLIIDPQRSFSEGAWRHSIGPEAESDTAPIRAAFSACAATVAKTAGRLETAFTRCPFPPGSYEWDRRLAAVVPDDAPYFLKPGNSVLFPPSNGFASWLKGCIECGRRTLVIGGCTLNSCVRVSSVQIRRQFAERALQVMVDLSLCGARARNYRPSGRYRGDSAVASAVSQMTAAGVRPVGRVRWG